MTDARVGQCSERQRAIGLRFRARQRHGRVDRSHAVGAGQQESAGELTRCSFDAVLAHAVITHTEKVPGWHPAGMCGRYATARDPADLIEEFDVDRAVLYERHSGGVVPEEGSVVQGLPPNYNVAPTDEVYAVVGAPR